MLFFTCMGLWLSCCYIQCIENWAFSSQGFRTFALLIKSSSGVVNLKVYQHVLGFLSRKVSMLPIEGIVLEEIDIAVVSFGPPIGIPITPHFWAHMRGRVWSAKIDDISSWQQWSKPPPPPVHQLSKHPLTLSLTLPSLCVAGACIN